MKERMLRPAKVKETKETKELRPSGGFDELVEIAGTQWIYE